MPNLDITFASDLVETTSLFGGMAEWFNAPVLKTDVSRGTGGSNPSSSAPSTHNG